MSCIRFVFATTFPELQAEINIANSALFSDAPTYFIFNLVVIVVIFLLIAVGTKAYSESSQTSEKERFAKTVKYFHQLTIFTKRCILDV